MSTITAPPPVHDEDKTEPEADETSALTDETSEETSDETAEPAGGLSGVGGALTRFFGRVRRSMGNERALAVVAVIGVLGTLLFGGLWVTDRRTDQGEQAMAGTAEEFLLALTNFDAATVDEDFDSIVELGTGDFHDQADQFFGSDVREALKEVQASSRGEIRDLYVQSFDGDRGRVFAVVDQTIANNRFPQPQADQLRVELTLRHTGGSWLISDVLVLEAPTAAAGTATAVDGEQPASDGGDGEAPAAGGEG
jgi:Mce-associated membrane protein